MEIVCPFCGSSEVMKKGKRATQKGIKQLYQCKKCGKRFSEGDKRFRYPLHLVAEAVSIYNLGYNLEETARIVRKRYKTRVSRSTIGRWIERNRDILTFLRLREDAVKRYGRDYLIEKEVVHRGITYPFAYHRYKLDLRGEDFPTLRDYIMNFRDEGRFFEEGERCSEVKLEVEVRREGRVNQAVRMADFVLKGIKKPRERHRAVERFMLVNDSATVAMEVPIYFYEKKIGGVSGHIDILQVRFGKIYIMDFKPEAEGISPEGQLYMYALGLSFRTGIKLPDIRCAWFDDENYYEFEPARARVSL